MGVRSLALAGLVVAAASTAARADGVIKRRGQDVLAAPGHALRLRAGCGDDDPACASKILRVLSGLSFATLRGGAAAADDGAHAAGGLRVDAVLADYPIGSAAAGTLEVLYLPAHASTRVHAGLGFVEMFTCHDASGTLRAPILGQIMADCQPDSHLGGSAAFGDVVWDPSTNRVAARWAQLGVVVDLLGPPNTMRYLHAHLDLGLGVDAESVWHGADDDRPGRDHLSRGIASLRGMVRSRDGHWEARAHVEGEPALVGTVATLRDVGVMSELALLRHLLASPTCVVSVGVQLRADYWRDPASAMGAYDSPSSRRSLFAGVSLEVRRASSR